MHNNQKNAVSKRLHLIRLSVQHSGLSPVLYLCLLPLNTRGHPDIISVSAVEGEQKSVQGGDVKREHQTQLHRWKERK